MPLFHWLERQTGEYNLRNLLEGDQTFNINYVGYHSQEVDVTINDGETLDIIIELEPDVVEGEEVVVQLGNKVQMHH